MGRQEYHDRDTHNNRRCCILIVQIRRYLEVPSYEGNCKSDAFYHMRGSIEPRSEVKYFVDFDIFPIVIAENVTRV